MTENGPASRGLERVTRYRGSRPIVCYTLDGVTADKERAPHDGVLLITNTRPIAHARLSDFAGKIDRLRAPF